MSKFSEFNYVEKDQKGFRLLRLTEDNQYFIEDISFEKILSESFLSENVKKETDEFITAFSMNDYVRNSDDIYISLSVIDMYNCQRFLFEYDYQLNEFRYRNICYDKEDTRTMFSVSEQKEFIYITGNSSYDNYSGLETGLYPSSGGEQIKRVRLPNANQLYCTMKEDCAWFSKDLYTQDPITLKWDKSNTPQIYKLDYKEQQVYQYNHDGTYEILEWIEE